MIKKLLQFGEAKLKTIITNLFCMGCVLIAYKAFIFGKEIYLANFYFKSIKYVQNGQRIYTEREVNNLPLGIFGGVIYFIVILLIWKLVCELLYIIFERIKKDAK